MITASPIQSHKLIFIAIIVILIMQIKFDFYLQKYKLRFIASIICICKGFKI